MRVPEFVVMNTRTNKNKPKVKNDKAVAQTALSFFLDLPMYG